MWNLISVRLETMFVLVQDTRAVCTEHTMGSEIILNAPRVLIGDETQVEAHFGPFEDSVMSAQDRCPVCAKHTIGS
jgi:hypothetical protein